MSLRPRLRLAGALALATPWAATAARAPDVHAQDALSPPEYVANWYREAGYDFLVLSDHNVFTDPATLAELTGPDFILIPGEEVTSSFESPPVHVNALNIPGLVEARSATDLVGTIQANVDAIREVGGVPHVKASGTFSSPRGKVIYGIAVDDAHHFKGEFAPERANLGRGWVEVQAPALEPLAIVEALEQGRFFASTGVDPTFTIDGREPYVRARIVRSDGAAAWIQPVFPEGP